MAEGAWPRSLSQSRMVLELLLAFLAAGALYVALYSQVPYHDAGRFAAQVNSGHFVWDIGHIFMQPATLLWHEYLGFGEPAMLSQKHINTFATALAVAVFYGMTLRLRFPLWQRVAASVLVATSCSVMILAPTAHMKLLAFPFVNAALLCGIVWEQEMRRPGAAPMRALIGCAALLALAAAFLASALATAPFATLAVLLAARRAGLGWKAAFGRAVLFAVVCGGLFLVCAGFGFITFSGQPLTLDGLAASVVGKADLRPTSFSLAAGVAAVVFGTPNNLVAAPVLGSVGRAWITGQVPSLRPFLGVLAEQAIPWGATLVLLAVIYLKAARGVLSGRVSLLTVAFLCGAQAWTIYYRLIDPEHWFQLTVPTVLLFLTLFPRRAIRLVLPPWAAITASVNLAVIGIPLATYPLARYQAQILQMFTPRDLVLLFGTYPGGPWVGYYRLPGTPFVKLDQLLAHSPDPDAFYRALAARIGQTLTNGGKVVAFDILDPDNWNAPWSELPREGVTKSDLIGFFHDHFRVEPLPSIGGMKDWRILPLAPG